MSPGASRWRTVLSEPLLHFAVLGAALFALFAWVGGSDPRARRIDVGAGTIKSLASTFEQTWRRAPTRPELEALVADYVREEILAREARALGLDDGDVVVRRRLRQKIELLATSFGAAAEPSEADLSAWLRDHPDRYHTEPRLKFTHVYLSRDRRGAAVDTDAAHMLEDLRAGRANPSALGDSLLLPRELDAPLSEVAAQFGEAFAARVAELTTGEWTGPVESAYGLHLVRVDTRVEGHIPDLADVREEVLRDWQSAQAEAAREAYYRGLRESYIVVIDGFDAPSVTATAELAR